MEAAGGYTYTHMRIRTHMCRRIRVDPIKDVSETY